MIAYYLIQKCKQKMEENIALIKAKLSDPSSLISVNASGALVDAATGGLAGLAAFAEDYMEKNADTLLLAALKATGLEKTFMDAYNLAMNMLAMAVLAKNNLILRMLQECARSCMNELAAKDLILIELADKTKEMYAILSSLVATPKHWDDYYGVLRQAMALVAKSRTNIQLVANTYSRTDAWLDKRYDGTITDLTTARDLITPQVNNPAISKIYEGALKIKSVSGTPRTDETMTPEQRATESAKRKQTHKDGESKMKTGLAYFGTGLADNFPFPTTAQQWQATLALGKVSKQLVLLMTGYSSATYKCNLLIAAFKVGLDTLSTALPSKIKSFVISLLQANYDRMDLLTRSMALTLNGSETNIGRTPIANFHPNNLEVSVKGFKWVMDINNILSGYKLIPATQLKNLTLASKPVTVYKGCVARLKKMDTRSSGLAQLQMVDAEEGLLNLETQMLAFILEANNAVIGANVRKGILAVGRTILSRLELSLKADSDIYDIMEEFAFTELPENDLLNQMFGGVMAMLQNAGLDRAAGLLMSGDYAKLFGLNPREASYVGAALAALALLKNCFKSKTEKDKADEIYADLKGDADLLNISFSINFDLSIFKNLLDCLRLTDLSKLFNLQELLCGLVHDIVASGKSPSETQAAYAKMGDLFSF